MLFLFFKTSQTLIYLICIFIAKKLDPVVFSPKGKVYIFILEDFLNFSLKDFFQEMGRMIKLQKNGFLVRCHSVEPVIRFNIFFLYIKKGFLYHRIMLILSFDVLIFDFFRIFKEIKFVYFHFLQFSYH